MTKSVCIYLTANKRLEYSTYVEVPDDYSEELLQDLAMQVSETIDGGEFWDDPEYWERDRVEASLEAKPEMCKFKFRLNSSSKLERLELD